MKIGNSVIDKNGYKGVITNIFSETGQVQVQQFREGVKCTVICTYDNEDMLRVVS